MSGRMTEGQQGPTPRKKARHFRRAKYREKKTPQVAAIESYIRSPDHAVAIHTQPPHKRKTRLPGGVVVAGLTMGRTGPRRCIHPTSPVRHLGCRSAQSGLTCLHKSYMRLSRWRVTTSAEYRPWRILELRPHFNMTVAQCC